MNRRNLLAAGLASLVGVQMPEPASAAQTVTLERTPIQQTMHLYHNLKDFMAPHIQAGGWLTEGSSVEAADMFDQLLSYMMDQFGNLPCEPSDYVAVGHKRSNFTDSDLYNMTPGVIPLLVTSSIFTSGRFTCCMQRSYITNWHRFVQVYQPHIDHAYNHMLSNQSKSG